VNVDIPANAGVCIVNIIDVLGLGFTVWGAAVVRIRRRVGRRQVVVDRRRRKRSVEVPEEILVAVDIYADLRRHSAAIGGVAILAPQSRRALRKIAAVWIDAWEDDDVDPLHEGSDFGGRKVLATIADACSAIIGFA
jgi:hypothetical protein